MKKENVKTCSDMLIGARGRSTSIQTIRRCNVFNLLFFYKKITTGGMFCMFSHVLRISRRSAKLSLISEFSEIFSFPIEFGKFLSSTEDILACNMFDFVM